MRWKLLTNVKEMLTRTEINTSISEAPMIISSGRQMLILQQVQIQTQRTALKTLDVAGILRAYRIRQITEVLPALRQMEMPKLAQSLLPLTIEEEEITKRTPLGRRLAQLEKTKRYAQFLPEKRLAEIERLRLEPDAILHVEQLFLSLLERLLWTTRQLDIQQIMQELIDMVESKQRYLTPIVGLIALQKQLLQTYVPYYMEHPKKHNMLGLVVSMMTMQELKGKSVNIYATMQAPAQAIKQNPLMLNVEQRHVRQKALSITKKLTEWFNVVMGVFETADLQLSSKIPLFTDWKGKPLRTVTLLQVLGHNYLLSKNFATHTGLPENKWYYQYPRLEVIVTRKGLKLHKRMTIPESQMINFRRDDYIKTMRKWRGTHG